MWIVLYANLVAAGTGTMRPLTSADVQHLWELHGQSTENFKK